MKATASDFLRVATIATSLVLAGCVSSRPMPASWAEALTYRSARPPELAGTFAVAGSGGGSARLDALLWGEKLTPTPEKIRLRIVGKNQLEATALTGDAPAITKAFAIIVDEKTGGVSLPTSSKAIDPARGGVGRETHHLELFMGNDGRLYGHVGTGGAVLYAYVIPVSGERLLWFRWAPVSP